MMKTFKQKYTLDRPSTYQIKVPGRLDKSWAEWDTKITMTTTNQADGLPVTTFTGTIDQATLQGFLRRLYSFGLPLISVICVES